MCPFGKITLGGLRLIDSVSMQIFGQFLAICFISMFEPQVWPLADDCIGSDARRRAPAMIAAFSRMRTAACLSPLGCRRIPCSGMPLENPLLKKNLFYIYKTTNNRHNLLHNDIHNHHPRVIRSSRFCQTGRGTTSRGGQDRENKRRGFNDSTWALSTFKRQNW